MAEERQVIISIDDKGAVKNIKTIGKEAEKAKESVEDVGKAGEKAGKGLEKGGKGGKKFGKSLKLVGTAWKAIGIGAVIALLVRLAGIFGENQKVADAFAIVMETVSVITNKFITWVLEAVPKAYQQIKDFFQAPGKYWEEFKSVFKDGVMALVNTTLDMFGYLASAVKKLFTGDFSGALDDAKKALAAHPLAVIIKKTVEVAKDAVKGVVAVVKEVTSEVTDAVDAATKLVNAKKAAALAEVELQKLQLQFQTQAEKLRQQRDNDRLSIEDRIEANRKLAAVLAEQSEAEKKAAQAAIYAAKLQYEKTKNDTDLIALKTAQLKLDEIEERVNSQKSEQLTNLNALKREQVALDKSIIAGKREVQEIEANAIIDEELILTERLQLQRDFLDQKYQDQIADLDAEIALHKKGTQAYQDAVTAKEKANAQYSADVKKNNREQADADRALAQQKLKIAGDAFGALSDILGKNSKAGKAAAIAQAIINTYAGVTEIWKNPTTIPEPFGTIQKVASTALALKSGFSAVKAITSTKIPGGGGGGAGGGASATIAPPSFSLIGNSDSSRLSETIGDAQKNQKVSLVTDELEMHNNKNKVVLENTEIG
ncbi:MAG: hypothetical protein ACR2M7_01875 [Bdellovibrionales bacterium]